MLSSETVLLKWIKVGLASEVLVQAAYHQLNAEEQIRADRFQHALSKKRFILTRAALRVWLGETLSVDPQRVVLTENPNGKPLLESPSAELHFSVSHAGELAVIALSMVGPVGVDIECMVPQAALESLVARVFSKAEQEAWAALPVSDQLNAFYKAWVRKESMVKALGIGLTLGLSEVDVGWADQPRPSHLPKNYHLSDWCLHTLITSDPYVGALTAPMGVKYLHYLDSLTENGD